MEPFIYGHDRDQTGPHPNPCPSSLVWPANCMIVRRLGHTSLETRPAEWHGQLKINKIFKNNKELEKYIFLRTYQQKAHKDGLDILVG